MESELRPVCTLKGVSSCHLVLDQKSYPEVQVTPFPKYSSSYLLWYGQDRIYRERKFKITEVCLRYIVLFLTSFP